MVKEDPGGDGGYPTPDPSIEYEPVHIDVDSIGGFAQLLQATGQNLGNAVPDITALLKDPGGKYESGTPIGRDIRQERLYAIGLAHSEQMGEMTTLLGNVKSGIDSLGLITARIVAEFGDQDGLNGASVDEVDAVINGNQPSSRPEV
ncbi:hypothetical protein FB566_2523 [Stackebrandtia endophytica]|uniref:Uncharacterized protein n=1 Tax=Stackebrandtia endophytica TaxID=1496996 RepID=A0A543AWQ1_9ACTN|nr:hypothetical protein [Stackebrandtia endophytica]TQL76979.1 hypothetical protein FB566_2523 [Stackebrandtia endophytica]